MGKKIVLFVLLMAAVATTAALLRNKSEEPNEAYISTLIVPHHDLVAAQRTATFERVAPRTQDRRIILLSPNHYNNGDAAVQTRTQDFTTQYGTVPVSPELLNIAEQNGAVETPTTFEIEHGVKSLLPDIARSYPDTQILPLVIHEKAGREELQQLLNALNSSCADCLLILSADFSHYQPYQLSELHDRLSIRGLQNLDGELLDTLAEVEPMHHYWMSILWAKAHGTERFVLDQHTNSTELEGNLYAEGTTHVMGWYETGKPVEPEPAVSFTITGPMLFDAGAHDEFHPNYELLFNQLGNRVLWGTDLVLGAAANKNDRAVRNALEFLRFTHIADEALESPQIIDGHRQRLVLFSGDSGTIDSEKFDEYAQDNIVIYATWGEAAKRQQLARQWIDAGADLVIGASSQQVEPIELYNNRPIVYSLGAFVSSTGESSSLALAGNFTDDSIELLPLQVRQTEFKTVLQRSTQADEELLMLFKDLETYVKDRRGGLLFSVPK